jgi:RNA-directed DNA polymerase
MALKWILQAVYEQDFLDCSYGFRPNRSCHNAIKQLDAAVMKQSVDYVVEVDIRKFFDTVDHVKLLELLQLRIADQNILWLVRKFLKAGIMDAGAWQASEDGVPQGGIVSPILANIYLHYVLDVWFESKFQKQAKGYTKLIRYADDFVALCESKYDADRFISELEGRLAEFNLGVSKEKTRRIKFGRQAWKQAQQDGIKVATFDFLGFTHYCGKSRRGKFVMGHKTSKLSLNAKLKSNNNWLRSIRSAVSIKELWPIIKAKLIGHYNYFGISGNIRCLTQYFFSMKSMVFKWMNRRSQKKSMRWEQFQKYLDWNPLPTPRIYHAILY